MIKANSPNPQFFRDALVNLDGKWKFFSQSVDGVKEILVPYAPESELSLIGYTDYITECEYEREFEISEPFTGQRLALKFGAVNYEAKVFLNGEAVGEHRGGYTPFECDITLAARVGKNVLRVLVKNDLFANVPSGKQSRERESHGCFYTRVTGIWQSVWLERTPLEYIKNVKFYPNIKTSSVKAEVTAEGEGDAIIDVYYNGVKVGSGGGYMKYKSSFDIPLLETHLWEAGAGRLYDVTVSFKEDKIESYFGLREVKYDGLKFLLNGKPVFQRLVLDQGYYKDGLYTAPDDEALKRDIDLSLKMGFNGARLHQKVFDPRFLYHADKAGYLIWGEYPSWGVGYYDLSALGAFAGEWTEALERDFNHPSIITWCPLNETWCSLYDDKKVRDVRFVDAIYALTKVLDKTRPCLDVSGGYHGHKTDVYDYHDYGAPEDVEKHIKEIEDEDKMEIPALYAPDFAGEENLKYKKGLPINVSEYGGIIYDASTENGWGYSKCGSEEDFIARYVRLTKAILNADKISGFCYTQLYDVEQEQNGLYTYERKDKFTAEGIKKIAECNKTIAAIEK